MSAVPRPLTPAELRAAAEDARREARTLRLEAAALDEHARLLDDAAAKGLTINSDGVKLRYKMQAANAHARPPRKVGRPPEVTGPFRTWLDSIGWDVEYWCKVNGEKAPTMKARMRKGPTGRKMPTALALRIQNEAGKGPDGKWLVPATQESWPSGIN